MVNNNGALDFKTFRSLELLEHDARLLTNQGLDTITTTLMICREKVDE